MFCRVATVREKVWKMNIFQVREKSGNFIFSQGNLEKKKKSGNLKISKRLIVNRLLKIILSPAKHGRHIEIMSVSLSSSSLSHFRFPIDNS